MSIHIGDNNRIQNSVIAEQYEEAIKKDTQYEKKRMIDSHPILISFLVSFLVSFLLLFSFWDKVIFFIESLF